MLKKYLIISLVLFNLALQAGNDTYSVLKLDALSLISSEPRIFRVGIERGLNEKFSISFSGEVGRYIETHVEDTNGVEELIYSITGVGAMSEFRFYPFRKYVDAPLGTFVGAHLRARSVRESYDPTFQNITTFGFIYDFGVHVGYKLLSKRNTLELLLGLGIPYGNYVEPNLRHNIPVMFTEDIEDFLTWLRMEISIGFIFPELNMRKKKRDYVIG